MSEVEKLAIGLFNHNIERGQQVARDEGLDKIGMMPVRAEWENMEEEDKNWWRNEARGKLYRRVE